MEYELDSSQLSLSPQCDIPRKIALSEIFSLLFSLPGTVRKQWEAKCWPLDIMEKKVV